MTQAIATRAPTACVDPARLDEALSRIRARTAQRDQEWKRRFPLEAFAELRPTGALAFTALAGDDRPPAGEELGLVRAVAAADGSVGRIFDGHLNAIERLAVHGPPELRDAELSRVRDGRLLAGVWGGEPTQGEGPSAELVGGRSGERVRGVKTFCSGAGGLQRAAVIVRDPAADSSALVWLDLDDSGVEIDRTWYRAAGLVASESHRVIFHDVPVSARLGPPGAISLQPWFARDALRTAASWAGMADTAVESALDVLAGRSHTGELEALAAGRIVTAQRTIDAWLELATRAMDRVDGELAALAVHARVAISDAGARILDEAARACGSGPFARGGDLDRARRDLELFLLQHRLDPLLTRVGARALADRR